MVDSGRNGLDPRLLQPLDDLLRPKPGCEVDVADRQPEELVADRAADVAGQPRARAQRAQQACHPAAVAPFRGVELQRHCSRRERLTIIAAVAPQILRPFQSIS